MVSAATPIGDPPYSINAVYTSTSSSSSGLRVFEKFTPELCVSVRSQGRADAVLIRLSEYTNWMCWWNN